MKVGEVWAVDFPFEEDSAQSKIRPCIIMDLDTLEVLTIKVTKHESRDEYDIPIFKWQAANLPEPSYARVAKTMAFSKDSFIKKYGDLCSTDFRNISKAFIEYHINLQK